MMFSPDLKDGQGARQLGVRQCSWQREQHEQRGMLGKERREGPVTSGTVLTSGPHVEGNEGGEW